MATKMHTPWGRGYDSFLGYFHHTNDYWTHEIETCKDGLAKTVNERDLWMHNSTYSGPAHWLENDAGCSQKHQNPSNNAKCVFEEKVLTSRVKQIIEEHNESDPLFLFWSMHLVHMPLQVPNDYLAKYAAVDNQYRKLMRAMTDYLDNGLGEVVQMLKAKGTMWTNTLLVFHSGAQ
jgi:arylsulfatase I/J